MPASSVLRGSRLIASGRRPARTSSVSSPTRCDRDPSASSTASTSARALSASAMRGLSSRINLAADILCPAGGLFLQADQVAHDLVGQADAAGLLDLLGVLLAELRTPDAAARAVFAERTFGAVAGGQAVGHLFEKHCLEV